MIDSSEKLTPDLTKGKLLSDIGLTALVYDGIFQGTPVIIKQARNPSFAYIIQREHDFLRNPPNAIEHQLSDFGIPNNWKVRTRFVNVVPDAVTRAMYDKGVTVLEKVNGKTLTNPDESTNSQVPLKFHFGSIMGWVDMLRNLKKIDITMDSNIDSDLFLLPDLKTKTLHVIRVDCFPSPGSAGPSGIQRSLNVPYGESEMFTREQAIVDQVIDVLDMLYPRRRPYSDFMGPTIPTLKEGFRNGDVHDLETLFNTLKSGLQQVNWDDDFIKNGDNSKLDSWVGVIF